MNTTSNNPSYRVAVVALHPIQYQAGIWRTMARHPRLHVEVFYLDSMGVDGTIEPEQGTALAWDLPLLEGYDHRFLPNLSRWRFRPTLGRINPSLPLEILRGNHDAVLFHGYRALSNWLGLLTARLKNKLVIYRGEGTLLGAPSHPEWMTAPKLAVNRFFLRRCDAVAYSSEDNRCYQLARGAAPQALFPMPCAVDNELLGACIDDARPRDVFRSSLGIDDAATVIVSVGRFTERKRMGDIVSALAMPDLHDVHLLLAGSGPESQSLIDQAKEIGATERVHQLGFLKQGEVIEAMRASDVFVMASSKDPSPKALSEALFMGLPIICSDQVGTCVDLVKHDINGFAYPCGDVPALARALHAVASDPERRRRMSKASRSLSHATDFATSVEQLVLAIDRVHLGRMQ